MFKTDISMFHVISFNAFWKFSWLGNLTWDFLGVKFWYRDFWGFVGSPRELFGFDFCPHSIFPVA